MLFDLLLQRLRTFRGRREDDIAAGNERLDVGEPERFEQPAKLIHLHRMAANIDGAEEGEVLGHCRENWILDQIVQVQNKFGCADTAKLNLQIQ